MLQLSGFLRVLIKLPIFIVVALIYILVGSVGKVWIRDPLKRRRFYALIVQKVSQVSCLLLNMRVKTIDKPDLSKNYLFVGNHMGFLDIFVVSSQIPTLFVTSVEMQKTAVLGLLCEIGGCLFVERRSRTKMLGELEEIRTALKQGFSVTLFPEGTSSNGKQVLPLKKSFLVSGAGTGIPLKPMVLNYREINGDKKVSKWSDHVTWYGDITFVTSLYRLFSLRSIEAELRFFDSIEVESEEERKTLAEQLTKVFSSGFSPMVD